MSTIKTKDGTQIRNGCIGDSSQFYKNIASGPFFGANRPGANVSQGAIASFWLHCEIVCNLNYGRFCLDDGVDFTTQVAPILQLTKIHSHHEFSI